MGHTHSLMDEVGEMGMVPEVPNSPPEPNSLPTPRPALLPKAVNSSATAAIPSICQEKETIASCRCPDGHAIVPNALVQASVVKQDGHVVQRQYPAVRNYGECDICEARGTTHRCVQNCDYDLCERCFDQSSVEAARSQSQPPVEGEDSGQGDKNQSTAGEKEQGPQEPQRLLKIRRECKGKGSPILVYHSKTMGHTGSPTNDQEHGHRLLDGPTLKEMIQ